MKKPLFRHVAVVGAALTALFAGTGNGLAVAPADKHTAGADSAELLNSLAYFTDQRLAPNGTVAAGAYQAAAQQAASTPTVGGDWTEIGPYNYFTDDKRYADPTFSNTGSGEQFVSGRITAVAATHDGAVLVIGAADGGIWRSTDQGTTWTPVGDDQATTSIGAVTIDETSGCTVYVGTGEANTNFDSLAGVGLLRSTDCGQTFQSFGPSDLVGALIWRIAVDGPTLYVASSHGLWRSPDRGTSWTRVIEPNAANFTANQVTDVVVRPGTGGQTVVAAVGWRNGSQYNGLFESTDGGNTFNLIPNPNGWVPQAQQGRVTLAYSSDGSTLYAVDQDPTLMSHYDAGVSTVLGGVYSAKGGDPNGPWNQIANSSKLMNSGSAETVNSKTMKGYQPGVQAWYNQFLAVDPADANHMYLGLEEVYETRDGGTSWTTVGPYWNLSLPCFSYTTFEGSCPHDQTHPDQHAATVVAGKLFVGNDGGMWSRSLTNHESGGWTSLNRNLNTLQFYFAGAGKKPGDSGYTYYGGLQDNGTAKVFPKAQTIDFFGTPVTENAVQPFGGDGTNVIVDPNNPDNVITSYVYLSMARSNDGGVSWHDVSPADPNPRFVAPARADRTNGSHLIAAGEYFWESGKGFSTTASDWTATFDAGAGHSITAIDTAAGVSYAGWCGPCNPSMANGHTGFGRGMASNYGGKWHDVTTGLPNRYITGIWADPNRAGHVITTLSGYSRRWIASPIDPNVGHVFESFNGGASWTDITGDLPDAPANDIAVTGKGYLVVATDVGAFVSKTGGASWYRLGTKLPHVVIDSWTTTPGGDLVAATHGRGLWSFPAAALSKL